MTGRIPARAAKLAAAFLAATAVSAVAAGAAGATEVIYNNVESSPVAPAVVSASFEAEGKSSFGGLVEFGKTARKNPTVTVVMDSWACETGNWFSYTCHTEPGARFEVPITITISELGPGNTVGATLASGSKVYKIPYRPSANLQKCTGKKLGEWFSKGRCWTSKAAKITLPLRVAKLPSQAIITVAFNTSDYGAMPQRPKPCNSEEQGCPYDSLNVGVQDGFENPAGTPPSVGGPYPLPDDTFDSGLLESGWTGFQPLLEVKASL
ncbi:MAG: hypothetical protein ACHQC8_03615 [Solirubrobacterales bacterium]